MSQSEFKKEVENAWEALREVKDVISKHVQEGNLRPIDGIRGLSAVTANVLGYEEIVPRSQPSVFPFSSQS